MQRLGAITEPWAKRLGHICDMTPKERAQARVDSYNAGTGTRDQEDGYNCPICKNKGFISVLTESGGIYGEALRFCKCDEIRRQRMRLKKAGLLDVVNKMTFEHYETPERWQKVIKDTAIRFCEDEEHRWFFIGGQSGAGKSHICTAITSHYIDQGKRARYMVWFDDATRIKAVVNDAEAYNAAMDELKKADVLYIDDLFKPINGKDGQIVPPSYADVRLAIEIINYRYNNPGLITIISGERSIDELMFIDEALAGRISELSKDGGYCINLPKDSRKNWRLKGMVTL